MTKILISACLLGEPVRYDGKSFTIDHPLIKQWQAQQRLVSFCPEVAGGLPTPRDAAEIIVRTVPKLSTYDLVGGHGVLNNSASVQTQAGVDVSAAFIKGAQIALNLCLQKNIRFALLSARSPSCGNQKIYNGLFNKTLIEGMGVTAALLKTNGIGVFNQNEIEELGRRIKK
jgi:uncharacterized protein YbbK (DUF523 family)